MADDKSKFTVIDGKQQSRAVTEYGTTVKQEMFCHEVAKGKTLTDAYKAAYDAGNMAPNVIHNEASKLMNKPVIQERVRTILRELEEKYLDADAKAIRKYVFGRLMEESRDKKSSAAARIKALELLGKMDIVGMFTERKDVDPPAKNVEDLERQLQEKLRKFVASMNKG
jgi:predicted transcriptional regulator